MTHKYAAGAMAPETEFVTAAGEKKTLSHFKGRWIVLLFRRYLGCPLCRREMDKLLGGREDCAAARLAEGFESSDGLEVVAVFQSDPSVVKDAFPGGAPKCVTLVADPVGTLYRDFGVNKGSIFQYLAPPVLRAAMRAKKEGYQHGSKEGEEKQLPAEFIIDPEGIIRFARYGNNIADSASLEELLKFKEELVGG